MGNFTYIEPREDQTAKGIWQLIPEDASGLYKLEVSAQDETTLAYFVDDQLQWRWEIAPVPVAQLMTQQYGTVSIAPIDWFPAGSFSGHPDHMNGLTLHGGESVSILISGGGPEILTVTAEYHNGDTVETSQIQLQKNRANGYPFPEKIEKRYDGDDQYIIYSFEWDSGMFFFRTYLE